MSVSTFVLLSRLQENDQKKKKKIVASSTDLPENLLTCSWANLTRMKLWDLELKKADWGFC